VGGRAPQAFSWNTERGSIVTNDLERYFHDNPGRLIDKWDHHFDIYQRHLAPFRKKHFTLLEIGVFHGGSMQMWKKYFGSAVHIIGLDIDERTLALAEPGVEIV
jgi:cephalosporin hydroxylase